MAYCWASEAQSQNSMSTGRMLSYVALALLLLPQAQAQNAATYVAVDAHADKNPISPDIYGVAFAATSDLIALNCPLNRSGGDSETS